MADVKWLDPHGESHCCAYPGCDQFGCYGTKRRKPDGKDYYDWRCSSHRGVKAPVDAPAPKLPKDGTGSLF